MTHPKKHRVSNLKLMEISSVDKPAQTGAVSVLLKSDGGERVAIRKNAADVAGGAKPSYSVDQYEDAMFARAGELAKEQGSTPEQALAKGLSSDRELMNLAHAGEVARAAAYGEHSRKRLVSS